MYDILYFGKMADESKKVSEPKRPSKQTLFPILGSNSGPGRVSGSLLLPCASFKVEEHTADFEKETNHPNWLRNESYKDIKCSKYETTNTDQGHSSAGEAGSKRLYCDIQSNSDDDRELLHMQETKTKFNDSRHCESTRGHHQEKKKQKHKKKHKHKHSKPRTKELITEDSSKPDTIWIEEAQVAPEKAFRLHKKPDIGNRMYDSLYRLDIAVYKIRSNINCLGLSGHQVIDLYEKKAKKRKKNGSLTLRYWNMNSVKADESNDGLSTILHVTSKKPSERICLDESSGFVSLEVPGQQREGTEGGFSHLEEQSDTESNTRDWELLQKTAKLNKLLRENPHNIQAWLTLANFQEDVVQKEDSVKTSFTATGRERRKASTRTVIEKKIAVLEKALEQNATSVELIVAHLELCNETMDAEELLQKWKKLSFVHPGNTLLWQQYLLFLQSRFSVFSFSKVSNVFGKCLHTLSSIKEGTFASHEAVGDLESEMLDLFIRECQFARQSGHTEKAVASLQAMVELNCFCSAELEKNTPVSGQMAFLETFWDSGQPKFGENGASGWNTWMVKGNGSVSPKVLIDIKKIFMSACTSGKEGNSSLDHNDDEIAVDKDQPVWKNWQQVELSREMKQLCPWQPDREAGQTEEDCDDPERLVLFDDISTNLFKITDPTNKLRLVMYFLKFLGVSVSSVSSSTSADVQRFLQTSLEHTSQILEPNNPTLPQCLGLWQAYHWNDGVSYNTLQQWPSDEAVTFVRNIFVQSLPVFSGKGRSFLMTTWLWYEFQLTQKLQSLTEATRMYKDVRKLAKSLLKQPENRNDLQVWQVYAEMEWLSGNTEEARRVFDATLMMGAEMFPDEQSRRRALAPLFRSYAELEVGIQMNSKFSQPLSSDKEKKALHILVMFAEGAKFQPFSSNSGTTEVSAVRLLKCRRIFQKLHQETLGLTESQTKQELFSECGIACGSLAVHVEACSALFEYLGTGVSSVLCMCNEVLSVALSDMSSLSGLNDMEVELIFSLYIRLFKFHCNSARTLPLKETRNILHSVLERFPDNPEFLSFYIQRESKSVLTGEIRRTLDKVVQKATTPVPWIFALYYEQLRAQSLVSVMECTIPFATVSKESPPAAVTSLPVTGVVHRQCSLFERATSSLSGRHCVALWRMLMEFESKHAREKVKSAFYQALQNCPWAKVLYMDAVHYMPEGVQEIIDLMTEKEIRLRTPLEEIQLLLQE